MPRPTVPALFFLALLATLGRAQAESRYVIYLHGRIVEDSGSRRPTDPAFGTYEYDAILDSLGGAGFVVLLVTTILWFTRKDRLGFLRDARRTAGG